MNPEDPSQRNEDHLQRTVPEYGILGFWLDGCERIALVLQVLMGVLRQPGKSPVLQVL